MDDPVYKRLTLPKDFHHENGLVFKRENDFHNFKSEEIESDGDDLDDHDFDI